MTYLQMNRRLLFFTGCIAMLLVATGCCTFERDWQAAQVYTAADDHLAGCWEGSWLSGTNGHTGSLRAIITREGEDQYFARYKATYLGFIPFQWEMPMSITPDENRVQFEGSADLGWLAGGVYTYAGLADGENFNASYCSPKDHGGFQMRRLQPCEACVDQATEIGLQ